MEKRNLNNFEKYNHGVKVPAKAYLVVTYGPKIFLKYLFIFLSYI
jgi:hypothetical protein